MRACILASTIVATCAAIACGSGETDDETTTTTTTDATTGTATGATGASSSTGVLIGPQPAAPIMLGGGFTFVQWVMPPSTTNEDVSVEVRPEVSADTDDATVQYFGLVHPKLIDSPPSSGLGSMGLRTRLANQTSASDRRGISATMFDAMEVIPHGAAEVDTETCKEGMAVTCTELSLPYAWSNGKTYRLRYHLAGAAPTAGNVLLRASVTDVETDEETILGDAVVPTTWGKLAVLSQTFSRALPPPEGDAGKLCTTFAPSDVTFSNLRAQPGSALPKSWMQVLAGYTGPCVDFFHYDPTADGYRMRLGIYDPG